MLFLLFLIVSILSIIVYSLYEKNNKLRIAHELKFIEKENQLKVLKAEIASLDFDDQTVNMALNIIQKNEMLEKIRRKITKYSSQHEFEACHRELAELDSLIFETLKIDKDRDTFKIFLEKSNRHFYEKLNKKYPRLTSNEQRLCTLIRLDLSSKEIANILNITEKSVEMNRYRLRKKIQISTNQSLSLFIKSI